MQPMNVVVNGVRYRVENELDIYKLWLEWRAAQKLVAA